MMSIIETDMTQSEGLPMSAIMLSCFIITFFYYSNIDLESPYHCVIYTFTSLFAINRGLLLVQLQVDRILMRNYEIFPQTPSVSSLGMLSGLVGGLSLPPSQQPAQAIQSPKGKRGPQSLYHSALTLVCIIRCQWLDSSI